MLLDSDELDSVKRTVSGARQDEGIEEPYVQS